MHRIFRTISLFAHLHTVSGESDSASISNFLDDLSKSQPETTLAAFQCLRRLGQVFPEQSHPDVASLISWLLMDDIHDEPTGLKITPQIRICRVLASLHNLSTSTRHDVFHQIPDEGIPEHMLPVYLRAFGGFYGTTHRELHNELFTFNELLKGRKWLLLNENIPPSLGYKTSLDFTQRRSEFTPEQLEWLTFSLRFDVEELCGELNPVFQQLKVKPISITQRPDNLKPLQTLERLRDEFVRDLKGSIHSLKVGAYKTGEVPFGWEPPLPDQSIRCLADLATFVRRLELHVTGGGRKEMGREVLDKRFRSMRPTVEHEFKESLAFGMKCNVERLNEVGELPHDYWGAVRVLAHFSSALQAENERRSESHEDSLDLPRWDPEDRCLYFRGTVVRKVSVSAKNVILLISAFEESMWDKRIDSPLPPSSSGAALLRDTIKSLNRGLVGLRFEADGTGEGITWRENKAT